MGLYEVIAAPAVFVTDGTARIYQDTGDLLELTEDEAAGFQPPEALRQIGLDDREDEGGEPVSVPSGAPVTFVDGALTDGSSTSTIVDAPPETAPEPEVAPAPEPKPEKAERRGRGRTGPDGQD